MLDFIRENYTLIIIILGTMILGMSAAIIGVFSILRHQALAGDAMSHAALPGIVLAYIVTNRMHMPYLLIGAALAALVSILLIEVIKRFSIIKYDASLALILSAFFGLGQVLIVHVQDRGSNVSSGLEKFIFGQAALMLRSDVYFLLLVALIVFLVIILLWKELKIFVFDPDFGNNLGINPKTMSVILNVLTVIVVVIGLRTVGVVLMSALIIAPFVAARQWSNKLSTNTIIASLIGMTSGALGTFISYNQRNLPTGPVIIVVLSSFVIISLLFANKRGLIKQLIKEFVYKNEIKRYKELIHIYTQSDKRVKNFDYSYFITNGLMVITNEEIRLTSKGISLIERLIGENHV